MIRLSRPIGDWLASASKRHSGTAQDILAANDDSEMQLLLQAVRAHLQEKLGVSTLRHVSAICICQPHRCKKAILFTCLLVTIILAECKGCEFLWSSDSDSVVTPGAVFKTIDILRSSPGTGGAAARLKSFHSQPTYISKMIAAKGWLDQDVTRMQSACFASAECQPGPCSAFRIQALKEALLPWYRQQVLGHRMVSSSHLRSFPCMDVS